MPTFVLLSTLTPEGVQTIKNNPQRIREVNKEIEQLGASVKAQWAVLGRFDFVNIVEAPDEATMARVSLELGLARHGPLRVAHGDPGRRLHRLALGAWPRVLVVGGGGREHALVRVLSALARRSPRCCARRATPASRGTGWSASTSAADDVDGHRAPWRASARWTWWWWAPRRRWWPAWWTRSPRQGIRAFGPSAEAARLEGSKRYAKELMRDGRRAHRRLRGAALARRGAAAQLGLRLLPAGAQGGLARRGQGRDHLPRRGARRARRSTRSSPSAASATPRWCSRSSSRARSCRCWRCATASAPCAMAPAQDYKRIGDGDEGPNTGGMGSYSPVPGHRPRARRRAGAGRAPADRGRAAPARHPFHGVLYAGLMMTADGPEGAGVQLPLRRPRDPGGAAAAALGRAGAAGGLDAPRRASRAWSSSGRTSGR